MEIKDFKEFMKDTRMNELQTVGRDYIWTNNHTYSRIDKGLVNASWMLTMPSLRIQIQRKKNRSFRFFNCISDHPQFIQHVEQVWNVDGAQERMQEVWNKLKRVKESIKGINTQHYQGVENRITEARKKLLAVQEEMSGRVQQPDLIEKEKTLKYELEKWSLIEESIYKQRSRVQWLILGDSNSAYFFAQMKNINNLNGIQALTNKGGIQLMLEKDIEAEIMEYYKKLLGSRAESIPAINPNVMKMGTTLSREQQLQLIQPVTKEEIWQH
uniref:Uncharacterized protein LOC104211894 n=1 Tax=Nicotiana sylvestris TaxID=4096 RepID=A0A1U7VAN0_NICSY|nr:PREDICTED: uncharacterized protein LOC104211894 [Nicotiana sylvestris]